MTQQEQLLVKILYYTEQGDIYQSRYVVEGGICVSDIPEDAYGFQYYRLERPTNRIVPLSGRYFLGGQIVNHHKIPDNFALTRYVIQENCARVIRTRAGHYLPYRKNDMIIQI